MQKQDYVKIPVPADRVLEVYGFLGGNTPEVTGAVQTEKPEVEAAVQEETPLYFTRLIDAVAYICTRYEPVNTQQIEERLVELYVEGSLRKEPGNTQAVRQCIKHAVDQGRVRRVQRGLFGAPVDTEVPF